MAIKLEVFNPAGATGVSLPFAPRLNDLGGRTIGLLSNQIWQAHRALPLLQATLQQRYPDAKFVMVDGSNGRIQDDKTIDLLVEKGCDAVIVGNAA